MVTPTSGCWPDGPSIGDLLAGLARAGVEVRGLVWRSHGERVSAPISGRSNELLGRQINDAGGEVLLDQRVRLFGSHHQKFFVIRHRDDPSRDVAFVGGIDLSHSRRDDADHAGDPQAVTMDSRYGKRPPWHDAALELRGPVVADVLAVFAERWNDPHPLDRRTPYRMLLQRLARMPRHPEAAPGRCAATAAGGPSRRAAAAHLRRQAPPFPFAPEGERSIARAYAKAFARARSLIYIEDQYLWSTEVAAGIAEALERNPDLHVIAVVPRYPDSDGPLAGPPSRIGQLRAISMLRRAAPDRVGVFDLENSAGTPIYVHAKICIIDDTWFTCGSDNFNRRSWTTDSELTCAVFDTTADNREPPGTDTGHDVSRPLAHGLRLQLWAEHLGLDQNDPRLHDPAAGLELWNSHRRRSRPLARNRPPLAPTRRTRAPPHARARVAPPTSLGGSDQPPHRGPGRPPPPAARHCPVLGGLPAYQGEHAPTREKSEQFRPAGPPGPQVSHPFGRTQGHHPVNDGHGWEVDACFCFQAVALRDHAPKRWRRCLPCR